MTALLIKTRLTMKKLLLLLSLLVNLNWFASSCNQATTTDERVSVAERMAKARAAKAEKKATPVESDPMPVKPQKASAADYKTPVDKVRKGPNGEAIHLGERGAKFYINKNGNKTYLSSNQ